MKPSTKIDLFDFSNYPKGSKYHNNENNLFVRKMKNETWGMPVKDFIGLKSEIYTFITEENHISNKAKNINKNVV